MPRVLNTGSVVGPYEVSGAIGAGGMGEVYRARDTRLNRSVAIKVSGEQFTERFQREARAIASLNHSNICHLYDVGPDYLVMELVEGPTLAERIKEGAIPLEEALPMAAQIAEALEAAHEKGVVHRDLKPGNIKIKPDGTVKVLDFGLAKMGGTPTAEAEQSPTFTLHETEAGVILGTASYMSPEQAKGKVVDQRADIYAFGAVLYEMLTGQRLHRGETTTEILASVIKEEPQWDKVPARVRRLLRRCLEKDPQKRLRHIGDVMALVEDAPAVGAAATVAVKTRGRWRGVVWAAAACVVVAAAVGLGAWVMKPVPPKPVVRFSMLLPTSQRFNGNWPSVAISPDGTKVVYGIIPANSSPSVFQGGFGAQLYLRPIDSLEARAIPGTEGARNPFFSPDGQWIGFNTAESLKKVSLSGGPPISLADLTGGSGGSLAGVMGASWGTNGMIALASGGAIQQVSEGGGSVQPLSRVEKGELGHFAPELLPRNAGLLYNATSGSGVTGSITVQGAKIFLQSLKTGERRELIQSGYEARYAASGHVVYLQGPNLMAAPFDLGKTAISGQAVPVIEGVAQRQYDISASGSLVYVPGASQAPQLKLVWVDRKGLEQPLSAPAHNYVFPRIASDGRRIATGIEEAESQIWLYDAGRDTLSRLTFEKSNNFDPVWSPDGKRIVFKGAGNRLYAQPADGSGASEPLTDGPLSANDIPSSWSPDGQTLALSADMGNRARGTMTLSLKDRKGTPFGNSQRRESAPQFSPDGRWIAYDSNESGRNEIYVRPFPGPGGKWQISSEGGTEPVWNPKGKELFYRNRNKMMVVTANTEGVFSAGEPKVVFEAPYVMSPRSLPDYDVAPDGQRFLMVKAPEQGAKPEQINVVVNWFEELKRRVPAGK